jgi:hypothetical protein
MHNGQNQDQIATKADSHYNGKSTRRPQISFFAGINDNRHIFVIRRPRTLRRTRLPRLRCADQTTLLIIYS